MKFQLSADIRPRIGRLTQIDNYPEVNFPTPNCLLYTKFGAVPFLTNDIVRQIHNLPPVTFASLNFLRERLAVFQKFGRGLAEYSALKNDPTEGAVTRAANKNSVQIWAVGGRLPVTMEQYADCVISAQPVAFQMPVDNETSFPDFSQPSRKRCQKSVQRTNMYSVTFDALLQSKEELSKIPILVSLTGGNDPEQRLRGVASLDFNRALGIVIDGFFHEPLEGDRLPHLENVFTILSSVCSHLPSHLPRFLTNLWQPDEVVQACRCGIDLFDGSLPFRLTRSGIAWLYTAHCKNILPAPWIRFPLSTEELQADVYHQPIQPDCPCFACQRHNRGYVSHLHAVDEMLAQILLMIHNSTQCYAFFVDLRQAIAEGRFEEFAEMSKAHHFPEALLQVDLTAKNLQGEID